MDYDVLRRTSVSRNRDYNDVSNAVAFSDSATANDVTFSVSYDENHTPVTMKQRRK